MIFNWTLNLNLVEKIDKDLSKVSSSKNKM